MVGITHGISLKSPSELKLMVEGGRRLADIKQALRPLIIKGNHALMVETMATQLITKDGGQASFKMVPGYHWSTCVNVNAGLVHGIPTKKVVFQAGDIVSVDVGLYYRGFHTDTSFTVAISPSLDTKRFLSVGQRAIDRAIAETVVGNRIYDLSRAIETVIVKGGYRPVKALVGHGVGRALHEEPAIPCFTGRLDRLKTPEIKLGMTLAIEVMYALGLSEVEILPDGWTIQSCDGKITALFEETVAVTKNGPVVLTGESSKKRYS